MHLNVHSIQFKADRKLINFVEDRVDKLGLFSDNIISGEVFLRLEKSEDSKNKISEIRLHIPGKELFAKRQCKSFEEGIDEAVEALRRQLMKSKGKRRVRMAS
ncbi:MAG: ribosome-associated translation inhibitor RaiA [Cryomorphaceae bacterium]|nr:MAG: ribosome-associated translation inhibitor RaiA [Cryomorphaceae bacterium]